MTFARAHLWMLTPLLFSACHLSVASPADGTPCENEAERVCIAKGQALVCSDGEWEQVAEDGCTSIVPPPKRIECASSDQCHAGTYCTVDDGVCNSDCDGPSHRDERGITSCATVCTGTCEPLVEPPPMVCTSTEECPVDAYCTVDDGVCDSGCLVPFDAAAPGAAEIACPEVCTGTCQHLDPPVPPSGACTSSEECAAGSYCTVEDGVCNGCDFDAQPPAGADAAEPPPSCPAVCFGTCEVLPVRVPVACAASEQCQAGEYCTTEDGVCDSACAYAADSGAGIAAPDVCAAVCMGTCQPAPQCD